MLYFHVSTLPSAPCCLGFFGKGSSGWSREPGKDGDGFATWSFLLFSPFSSSLFLSLCISLLCSFPTIAHNHILQGRLDGKDEDDEQCCMRSVNSCIDACRWGRGLLDWLGEKEEVVWTEMGASGAFLDGFRRSFRGLNAAATFFWRHWWVTVGTEVCMKQLIRKTASGHSQTPSEPPCLLRNLSRLSLMER